MSLAATSHLAARVARIRTLIADASLDALIVSHLPNIFYLTNLVATSATLVVAAGRLYLLTDFRYIAAVESLLGSDSAPPDAVFVRVEGSYDEALARILEGGCAGMRVGFESAHVSVRQHAWLAQRLHAGGGDTERRPATAVPELVASDAIVERSRACKDEYELGVLREAGRRLSEVAISVLGESIRAGRPEREVAADIDFRLKMAGFDRPAFDTIVASGPHSALPHARPTERRIEADDLVLLDFGGVYRGYCVDLTRTVAVGDPGAQARRLYRAVADAQDAALAAVRADRLAHEVDAAARDVLAAHGLAEAFGHGTGHGLGLEVHEEPRLTKRRADVSDTDRLAAGMVCTIEPGAYVPGAGGVRLEDDVIVTRSGSERITDVPRDGRLLS
jgi:Xaa-Pro aminopeptidase